MAHLDEEIPWTRRARSGLLLVLLAGALGAVAAVVVGGTIVVAASFIDHAL